MGLFGAEASPVPRSEVNMASTNPRIRTLERLVQELERVPLLHKAAVAREVAVASLELFAEIDQRLAELDMRLLSIQAAEAAKGACPPSPTSAP
jgi:hypothetical protein